jgi:5'-nucleotidase
VTVRPLLGAACAVTLLLGSQQGHAQQPQGARLRILVANDDGFQSPGLIALVDSLIPLGDVVVAAPREQQSGTGHGITYRDPIRVDRIGNPHGILWMAVDARPATVVRLALTSLMDSVPDVVVSGVNTGDNAGIAAWLSGTVAAAREAALAGIPAIAVSASYRTGIEPRVAAGYVRRLIENLAAEGHLVPGLLLNVNIPAVVADSIRGVRVAPMSLAMGEPRYERRQSPRGVEYYWDTWVVPEDDPVEGTDLHWFAKGYITVTPLVVDQTDREALGVLRGMIERP